MSMELHYLTYNNGTDGFHSGFSLFYSLFFLSSIGFSTLLRFAILTTIVPDDDVLDLHYEKSLFSHLSTATPSNCQPIEFKIPFQFPYNYYYYFHSSVDSKIIYSKSFGHLFPTPFSSLSSIIIMTSQIPSPKNKDFPSILTQLLRHPAPVLPPPCVLSQSLSGPIAALSLHPTLEAALHILNRDLPSAHFLVRHMQAEPAFEGMFLHGILHRVEGDYDNARAW